MSEVQNKTSGRFDKTDRWFASISLPNKLTLLRIAIVPLYLAAVAIPGLHVSVAFVLFLIGCITDFLDGHLARSLKLESSAGALLDPVADKLFVISPLVLFVAFGAISPWYVVIIVARELIINAVRLVAANGGTVIAASKLGKIKTTIQLMLLSSLTLKFEVLSAILAPITAAITVISLVEYLYLNRSILGELK